MQNLPDLLKEFKLATDRDVPDKLYYFHSNHLGSGSLITDKNGGTYQTLAYAPWGEDLVNIRHYSDWYDERYQFGGHHFDTESGLLYQGARHNDTKLSINISPDARWDLFPHLTAYNSMGNNPIMLIDPDGRIITLPKGTSTKNIYLILGNLQKLTNDKLVYSTQKDGTIKIKVASLGEGNKTAGTNLIRRSNSSDKTMTIQMTSAGSGNSETDVNSANAINGKGTDVNVYFDPTSDPSIMTEDPKTGNVSGKKRPSQVGLAHEMIHGERSMRGEAIDYDEWGTQTYKDASGKTVTEPVRKEEAATSGVKHHTKKDITENQIRKEQGQNKRGAY
jgi:RHS repeat-associated protein